VKFSGVTILQGVEISIFLLIFEWALQQCSATALPVILVDLLERINHHLRCARCPACFLPFDVLVGIFYTINII